MLLWFSTYISLRLSPSFSRSLTLLLSLGIEDTSRALARGYFVTNSLSPSPSRSYRTAHGYSILVLRYRAPDTHRESLSPSFSRSLTLLLSLGIEDTSRALARGYFVTNSLSPSPSRSYRTAHGYSILVLRLSPSFSRSLTLLLSLGIEDTSRALARGYFVTNSLSPSPSRSYRTAHGYSILVLREKVRQFELV
eukprot:sb/3470952/